MSDIFNTMHETDMLEVSKVVNEKMEEKMEDIKEGAEEGFNKVSDKFVEKFFAKDGETVEEAKARLSGETKEDKEA